MKGPRKFNYRPASESLWAKINAAAKENHRSVNAEMNVRLERSFKDEQFRKF